MRKLLLLLLTTQCLSQDLDVQTSHILPELTDTNYVFSKAGSCASPDGTMKVRSLPPLTHQSLETNGYCYQGIASTSNVTMCFTFVPTTSAVILNAGFSESCENNNITSFDLYDSTCTLIYSGLTPTGLIVGQTYVWCVTMRAWGGPFCNGYTTFCPYWIPIICLPVELTDFYGSCDCLVWKTASEYNCDYYTVEGSNDGIGWAYINKFKCGNSTSGNKYKFSIGENRMQYYRLTQYDFDGAKKVFDVIAPDCNTKDITIFGVYNSSGQYIGKVLPDYVGIYFIKWSTGEINKIVIR